MKQGSQEPREQSFNPAPFSRDLRGSETDGQLARTVVRQWRKGCPGFAWLRDGNQEVRARASLLRGTNPTGHSLQLHVPDEEAARAVVMFHHLSGNPGPQAGALQKVYFLSLWGCSPCPLPVPPVSRFRTACYLLWATCPFIEKATGKT